MKKALRLLTVLGVSTAVLTGVGGLAGSAADAAPARAVAVSSHPRAFSTPCIAMVNAERKKAGRRPVTEHRLATAAAVSQSRFQSQRLKMSHTGSGGSNAGHRLKAAGYGYRAWGENVAAGYLDCKSVMRGWMNSSGHKANILSSKFVHIGMAAMKGSNGAIYWTMVLATPR